MAESKAKGAVKKVAAKKKKAPAVAVEEDEPQDVPAAHLSQAYENAKALRKIIRSLKNATPYGNTPQLNAARAAVDAYAIGNPLLKQAIAQERAEAAKATNGFPPYISSYIDEAYTLVQKIPSYRELPEGEDANKIRSIEALLKVYPSPDEARKAKLFDAFKLIVNPKKAQAVAAEKVPQPQTIADEQKEALAKQKAAQAEYQKKLLAQAAAKKKGKPTVVSGGGGAHSQSAWSSMSGWQVAYGATTGAKSPYHMQNVDQTAEPWGIQKKYSEIPDGVPITWGALAVWIDKGLDKTEGKESIYFVHPAYAPVQVTHPGDFTIMLQNTTNTTTDEGGNPPF